MNSQQVTIVSYHYVRNLKQSRYPEIRGLSIDSFIKQLNHFKKNNYNFISTIDLIEAIEQKAILPDNALLLTFNDNYIDHFKNVFPILDEMKIPGCFFPEVRAIQEDIILPNHKIHYILAAAGSPKKIVLKIFDLLKYYKEQYRLQTGQQYFDKLAVESRYDPKEVIFIKRLLQSELNEETANRIIDHLYNEFVEVSEHILSKELYMNQEQILCMNRHGMHFGIIGYNHKRLPSLTVNEQESEINKAVDFFSKNNINPDTLTVTYPWNEFSDTTKKILSEHNIKAAFKGGSIIANLNEHSRYELPRFDTNDFQK